MMEMVIMTGLMAIMSDDGGNMEMVMMIDILMAVVIIFQESLDYQLD